MANVVYYASAASLVVDTPIACRLAIFATGDLDTTGGLLQLAVDSVNLNPASTAPAPGTLTVINKADVTVGLHTITLTATGAILTNPQIMVRRGRINAV